MDKTTIKTIQNKGLAEIYFNRSSKKEKIKAFYNNTFSFVTEINGEITAIVPFDNLQIINMEPGEILNIYMGDK